MRPIYVREQSQPRAPTRLFGVDAWGRRAYAYTLGAYEEVTHQLVSGGNYRGQGDDCSSGILLRCAIPFVRR